MDAEKLANFRNKVMNLADGSPLTDWENLMQAFGDLYKDEVREALSGGALTTELTALDVAIAAMITEMNTVTSAILKPS